MIVSYEKKFVYISIPKTASKTISCVLGQGQHPEPSLYHMGIREALKQHPEAKDYYQWSFVRNPFARLVSIYFDFTKNRVDQYSSNIKMEKPLLHEFSSFRDFCIRLCDSHWREDIFFLPQKSFITRDDGSLIDFVGRQENIVSDFDTICDKLDLGKHDLIHVNKGKYDKQWMEYYLDKDQITAVKKIYHEDLEVFGYEF